MSTRDAQTLTPIARDLATTGHCLVPGPAMLASVGCQPASWAAFSASWDDLEPDRFMGDGGRYRYRRHANFRLAADGTWSKGGHRPHIQAVEFNQLNGGIERWFAPIAPAIAEGDVMQTLLSICARAFSLDPAQSWFAEAHQFRIVADAEAGKPTPEGLHHDGVDFVFISLIERHNVVGGVTRVVEDKRPPISHTLELASPGDSLFLVDPQVRHEVSAISAAAAGGPGHRDALVLTFARLPSAEPDAGM